EQLAFNQLVEGSNPSRPTIQNTLYNILSSIFPNYADNQANLAKAFLLLSYRPIANVSILLNIG
ncbi:hypothetical protein, partial [Shewanella indica]|uniref:hypothetical protein n=1 Tax=Shewanella indica TaxID=768528 RepID=UPI0030043EF2